MSASAPEPPPVMPDAPPMIAVYVLNATRTSDGPGPGVKHLPADEANRLIYARMAVYGDQPPRGMGGVPEPAVREFR